MELLNIIYTSFTAIILAILLKNNAKRINKLQKENLPVKLFTYELTPDGSMVAGDKEGMAIPIKLCDDFPLQIPTYTSEGESHQIPYLEYNNRFWRIETCVQLKEHVNIFVLPMGPINPKAPLCAK